MTFSEVNTMLQEVGIPTAYYQFDNDSAPEPPFICFLYTASNDMYADDSNYQHIANLAIELYTDNKDFDLESKVESVLRSHGFTWTKDETFIDSERLFEVVYETNVVITTEV